MGLMTARGECGSCYGSGVDRTMEPCRPCRGTGRELTEIGKEVIDFLSEHFILTPKSKAAW